MKKELILIFIFTVIALVVLAPTSDPDQVPDREVGRFTSKIRGNIIPARVVLSNQNEPFWIQQIVTGFRPTSGNEMPSKVISIENMNTCQFKMPTKDEVFANIFAEYSNQETPIFTVSREELAINTKRFIEAYTSNGKESAAKSIRTSGSVDLIDVFITETEKPVYLVLTASRKVIWNIQKTDNVKISHVALIGNNTVGVANLDESVPIEVLADRKIKQCNVFPARNPLEHWGLYRNAQNNSNVKEALNKNSGQYQVFSRWFKNNFGFTASYKLSQANRVNHFLVGKIPDNLETRIPYKSLEGATVRLSRWDHILVVKQDDYKKKYVELVSDFARKMVGGDLASLYTQN